MQKMTIDGNRAAAYVSYAFSEIAVIYPITPSTPMAELADEWATGKQQNLFGQIPKVVQMQSESGVAGALHGALSCGALATTYTCSQGLLLMQPNMFKIAGELLPTVFHVSARALATHALSIFGDHQDVMACRQTGFAMLCAASVQETFDLALVAHLATLQSSVPFLHFFDGFRTSHEINKIDVLSYEEMKPLVSIDDVEKFRRRALSPDKPIQRGTAQNPDVYFQNREAANAYYLAVPSIVQRVMDKVRDVTGRSYSLFDYVGSPSATHVVVMMGSGSLVMQEVLDKYKDGQFGVLKVRLYRPFDGKAFCKALPQSCKVVTVLDRTKENGALGEPLYLDVCSTLMENGRANVRVLGGRYGLGSKEFTPAMCLAVLKNMQNGQPKNHFTVGINDDVTNTSLEIPEKFVASPSDCTACKFYGLGSDGTVGANKNSIKILGEHTNLFVQAYFQYDSRKSGGATISHLRFGKSPIHSAYLVQHAHFIACHNSSYLTRYDMLSDLMQNGMFLLNCAWETEKELEENLPAVVKRALAQKQATFYVIDATKIANEVGLNGRTSTIMQSAFFFLNPQLMPYERAQGLLKEELRKKFARKGEEVVQMNVEALDMTVPALKQIVYPESWKDAQEGKPTLSGAKDEYFQNFIQPILSLKGDELPVSAFQADGSVPTGTTRLEKHGVPYLLPKWILENCIECNQCSFVCPHATIRPFVLSNDVETPDSFRTKPAVQIPNTQFRVQIAPHDCMGCGVCADVCPAKEKALVMVPAVELMPSEGANWEFAVNATYADTSVFKRNTVKGSQFYPPLFEFSYACAGCGETAYIKVLTQLFGERMTIANATGCSSIYGGSSPTCPYTKNKNGQGPAWANSLFEDNAEFGMGMRLAYQARNLFDKSVWIIGGDGWAYDIGYGGLDHVLASGVNVNVLVLDSEVYSNTGGQTSKASPLGSVARFSVAGKGTKKKPLALMAMIYGNVYVAQVSLGANKQQLINALTEAEAYDGPSLIVAYSPCIAHGVNMSKSVAEEKRAVDSGYWQLFRFNPNNSQAPFTLDSKAPTEDFQEFLSGENRFASLKSSHPERAQALFEQAEIDSKKRIAFYQKLTSFLNDTP